jgi:hypothetical protein
MQARWKKMGAQGVESAGGELGAVGGVFGREARGVNGSGALMLGGAWGQGAAAGSALLG